MISFQIYEIRQNRRNVEFLTKWQECFCFCGEFLIRMRPYKEMNLDVLKMIMNKT